MTIKLIGFLQATLCILPAVLPVAAIPATITLYDVIEPTVTGEPHLFHSLQLSETISPVSVNGDGQTVYDEVIAITGYVYEDPQNSKTVTSASVPPQPTTLTLVEDASGFELHYTGGPIVVDDSCAFQGTTRGTCVNILGFESIGPSGSTYFSTFTGVPTPIFTYVAQVSSATPRMFGKNQGGFRLMMGIVSVISMVVLCPFF